MRSAVTALQMAVRVLGVIQLVLGLLFWTGNARGLVDLHMLNGILLMLVLWALAGLAARAGVPPGLTVGAAVWGLVVVVYGIVHPELLPGSAHWVIQVVHLLLGLSVLALAENLATRAKGRLAPVA